MAVTILTSSDSQHPKTILETHQVFKIIVMHASIQVTFQGTLLYIGSLYGRPPHIFMHNVLIVQFKYIAKFKGTASWLAIDLLQLQFLDLGTSFHC